MPGAKSPLCLCERMKRVPATHTATGPQLLLSDSCWATKSGVTSQEGREEGRWPKGDPICAQPSLSVPSPPVAQVLGLSPRVEGEAWSGVHWNRTRFSPNAPSLCKRTVRKAKAQAIPTPEGDRQYLQVQTRQRHPHDMTFELGYGVGFEPKKWEDNPS